jgi:hypothetical protein
MGIPWPREINLQKQQRELTFVFFSAKSEETFLFFSVLIPKKHLSGDQCFCFHPRSILFSCWSVHQLTKSRCRDVALFSFVSKSLTKLRHCLKRVWRDFFVDAHVQFFLIFQSRLWHTLQERFKKCELFDNSINCAHSLFSTRSRKIPK